MRFIKFRQPPQFKTMNLPRRFHQNNVTGNRGGPRPRYVTTYVADPRDTRWQRRRAAQEGHRVPWYVRVLFGLQAFLEALARPFRRFLR